MDEVVRQAEAGVDRQRLGSEDGWVDGRELEPAMLSPTTVVHADWARTKSPRRTRSQARFAVDIRQTALLFRQPVTPATWLLCFMCLGAPALYPMETMCADQDQGNLRS
jgi:hypothetical protein